MQDFNNLIELLLTDFDNRSKTMHSISQGPMRHQKSSGRFGTNLDASLF